MSKFIPPDANYEDRVRLSFSKQSVMSTIGASIIRVAPGEVDIEMPFRPALSQQHGFIHAGVITTIIDSACGYAALTLMPSGAAVLTVEFKVNLLAPAAGERFVARGRVKKPGRTISVCEGDVFSLTGGNRTLVATMLATMICLTDRAGLID
jgi:uncharacterized protein (TIGR00369 family)